jgi:transposase
VTSSYDPEALYVGMDVHKDTISVGVFEPGSDSPVVDKIFHDEASVRRLVAGLSQRGRLRMCYEAGPTGYELQRLLASLGVACEVIAPSLIPRRPGDRVKTDKRDSRRMVRLYRAGELVAMHVPSVAEEAVRDLCRARADLVDDRDRARKRLLAFLRATRACTGPAATGPASICSGWPRSASTSRRWTRHSRTTGRCWTHPWPPNASAGSR